MRTKKDKEKPLPPNQRHSSAANYELSPQSAMLHEQSDEDILALFEKMLVRKKRFLLKIHPLRSQIKFIILNVQFSKLVILRTTEPLIV